MRLRLPWVRHRDEEQPVRPDIIQEEQEAMRRDIGQIKLVNRHLLAKALKEHWIEQDVADSIKSIQMDEGEHRDGAVPRAPD